MQASGILESYHEEALSVASVGGSYCPRVLRHTNAIRAWGPRTTPLFCRMKAGDEDERNAFNPGEDDVKRENDGRF